MRLGWTEEQFREKLRKAIYEASVNSKVQEEIIDRIAQRGYRRGMVSGVFEGNIPLNDSLSPITLGVFALEIFKVTNIGYINPNIYLTDVEMERVVNHKEVIEQDVFEYPVEFDDVRYVAPDIWTVVLPAKFIAKLGRSNMLNYEFETQREAKLTHTKRGIIPTPRINPESIVEITDELITGNFIPNTLTFNIPLRESSNFKYDAGRNKWILLEGKINIIDGYHRYRGIVAAVEKGSIDYNFEVRLTNFDDDKARKFIVQEDKRNPISQEYIRSIDDSSLATQVIRQLNQSNRSELRGRITANRDEIELGNSLVSFDIMHKTIDKLWILETIDEADELFDYLRVFFNRLVDLYKDDLKPDTQAFRKKDSIISDERMFVLYLIIAKKLQSNDNWRKGLERIMFEIELNTKLLQDYLKLSSSAILHRFNRAYGIANEIVEVIANERQVV